MAKVEDIKAELKTLGVEFDPKATKEALEALLESHKNPAGAGVAAQPAAAPAPKPAEEHSDEIIVGDPLSLKPVDLPLVVKPAGKIPENHPFGGWKNAEQSKFAQTLNAHAYQFPDSWQTKKDKLVGQLSEIGKNPDLFYLLSGETRDPRAPQVKVNDKRVGQGD